MTSDSDVRTAAARCAGMSRDRDAIGPADGDGSRRTIRPRGGRRLPRSARSARLGGHRALLAAAANPEDRFVEHSIIYSLITLDWPDRFRSRC